MHLSPHQIEAIKHEAAHFFDAQAGVCASCSRAVDRQRGFTLVELIMVMVIVGVLAAVVAPKFFDNSVFQSRGFSDQVQATLRYAQKTAIAQRRFVCVAVGANPASITLTCGDAANCGFDLAGPSGPTPYSVSNNNVAITSPAAGNFISFDCLGRPRAVGNPAATCAPGNAVDVLLANQTVQVQGAPIITVEMETGYVH